MKFKTYLIFLVTVSHMLLTGCASEGYGFNLNADEPYSQPFEAQYRLLLVTNNKDDQIDDQNGNNNKESQTDGQKRNKRVVCAEPSPDAMKVLGLNAKIDYNDVGLAMKSMQSMGEIGERTALVQLLRDNLYRSCEAYMNGLLTKEDYQEMLAFWDVYTVTLLGIDSLSRTTRQPVTISAGSTADDAAAKSSSSSKYHRILLPEPPSPVTALQPAIARKLRPLPSMFRLAIQAVSRRLAPPTRLQRKTLQRLPRRLAVAAIPPRTRTKPLSPRKSPTCSPTISA